MPRKAWVCNCSQKSILPYTVKPMPNNSKEQTPYDHFKFEIPEQFPSEGISARAVKAIVTSSDRAGGMVGGGRSAGASRPAVLGGGSPIENIV
jgi:hypothetical protein